MAKVGVKARGKLNLQTIVDGSNQYQVNDIVLALFGNAWYEAKVLECYRDLDKDAEPCYFIHYSGWSKKTDELVPEDRLQKKSDENASMALSVKDLKCLKKKRKPRNMSESTVGNLPTASSSEAGESAAENDFDIVLVSKLEIGDSRSPQIGIDPVSPNIGWSPGSAEGNVIVTVGNNSAVVSSMSQLPASIKDRKRSGSRSVSSKARSIAEEPEAAEEVDVKPNILLLYMSEGLKEFLWDSCEKVACKPASELPVLPHKPNVSDLLCDYTDLMNNTPEITEFVKGLRSSFNFYLEKKLLYESEQEQLKEFQERLELPELPEMASLYGVSHLLRFFTIIEPMLAAEFPAECIPSFMQRINKFLEFIDANLGQYCPAADSTSTNPTTVETANTADTTSPVGNIAA